MTRSRFNRSGAHANSGTILIVTMWIVLVLAGMVLVMAQSSRVEAISSANQEAAFEAEGVARGALAFVISAVDGSGGSTDALASLTFDARQVGDGYFWLIKMDPDQQGLRTYGLQEESAKVNINSAPEEMLLKLPNMTADLADAIVDWRDPDADVSPNGAESQYYLLLPQPYICKDGPFETVDEMLLLRGATPELIRGEDTNMNYELDENENDGDTSAPPDNRNGTLDVGLAELTTVYSMEPNTAADGSQRVNVNSTQSQDLSNLLGTVIKDDRRFTILDTVRRNRPYDSILQFFLRSGMTRDEFGQIADKLTTSSGTTATGLLNVNSAPREALLCLPQLDESDVAALVAKRAGSTTTLTNIAWVLDALTPDKAEAIGPYITTRTYQFTADIVAVSGNGRAFKRYLAVIDTRTSPPAVKRWENITRLGWPLDPALLSDLRHGITPTGS